MRAANHTTMKNTTDSNLAGGCSHSRSSTGSDSYGLKHPKITAWKRKNRKAFEAHDKANAELVSIFEESPRRPWYRKRHERAINKWGETLDAIPMPPSPNAEHKRGV